jgi:spore germination cell wall hydrolase CwlJ-like protein
MSARVLRQMQRLISKLMRDPLRHPRLAAAIGLSCEQLMALEWVAWLPGGDNGALTAGLADNGVTLPRRIVHPRDGAAIPLRSVRGVRGVAQGGWMVTSNASHDTGFGTLNSILVNRAGGQLYALTAGHVLAASSEAGIGDDVTFSPGAGGAAVPGRLNNWIPYFQDGRSSTTIDAAVATIDQQRVHQLQMQGLEHPTGSAALELNRLCVLRTRNDYFFAVPRAIVSCWLKANDGAGGKRDYFMEHGVGYDLTDSAGAVNGDTTRPGDSGAPLWDYDERLVGMHLGLGPGGAQGSAIALPIQTVLDWCGAEVLTRGAAPLAPAPAAGTVTTTTTAAPVLAPPATRQTPVAPVSAASGTPDQSADTLARTIWAEARGEPDARAGMAAVANVVLNRVRWNTYWGRSIAEVCQKPYQFSCWNKNDPNLPKLLAVTAGDPKFALALELASAAVNGNPPADATRGATHYHARGMAQPPGWGLGHQPCAAIGNHLFFNDIK